MSGTQSATLIVVLPVRLRAGAVTVEVTMAASGAGPSTPRSPTLPSWVIAPDGPATLATLNGARVGSSWTKSASAPCMVIVLGPLKSM